MQQVIIIPKQKPIAPSGRRRTSHKLGMGDFALGLISLHIMRHCALSVWLFVAAAAFASCRTLPSPHGSVAPGLPTTTHALYSTVNQHKIFRTGWAPRFGWTDGWMFAVLSLGLVKWNACVCLRACFNEMLVSARTKCERACVCVPKPFLSRHRDACTQIESNVKLCVSVTAPNQRTATHGGLDA